MNPADLYQKIALLKHQIESDPALDLSAYESHLQEALAVLDEIAASPIASPLALAQIAQVKRSFRDYYDPQFSRGWTHRFVLTDLQALENLCMGEQHPGDAPRFAA
jgi:hypothetical protein